MTEAEATRPLLGGDQPQIRLTHALLIGIIFLAAFTRLWRLGEPTECYFDEVYFPTTAAEILHGHEDAWEFYGHENTHPPLSKDLMAVGEAIFGTRDLHGGENTCWGDADDKDKRVSNDWAYKAFGYRFPGALAGIFSVVFVYLLARKLFKSEVAGLASAFLLSIDGLVLTQSRIATPDTFVLCFLLGSLYFLLRSPPAFTRLRDEPAGDGGEPGAGEAPPGLLARIGSTLKLGGSWPLAGLFLGAAAATKWNGAFVMAPIVIYFAWAIYNRWRDTDKDPRLREAERVLLVGAFASACGVVAAAAAYVVFGGLSWTVLLIGGVPFVLGIFVIAGGLIAIATEGRLRNTERGHLYLSAGYSFPLYFLVIPFGVYMAAYIPMFLEGHGLYHWWDLNRMAYEFHSSLGTPHPYESSLWSWPIDMRPVYFYLGTGRAKIYNLGNPIIFWMAIPALIFVFWQVVRTIRVRVEAGARLRVWGTFARDQFIPLFVILSYLSLWLALSAQKRALFLYHYQPALSIAVLALGYSCHRLWYHPHPWSRHIVIGFLAASFVTFLYFFPHWTAIDVPAWWDDSYYWFPSWS